MKYLRIAAFALCLLGWGYWGVHYGYPLATSYLALLQARQGVFFAQVSFWASLTVLLWVYYAAAMNLKRAIDEKRAPLPMQVLGYTLVLPPGLFLDWLVNMVPMTVISGDPPEHPGELVTGRLDRYARGGDGHYRQTLARFFGTILHALDPRGYHF